MSLWDCDGSDESWVVLDVGGTSVLPDSVVGAGFVGGGTYL